MINKKLCRIAFLLFVLNGQPFKYVSEFCYLGHVVTNTENDVHREIHNVYIRTNMLFREYNKCSIRVKYSYFVVIVFVSMELLYGKGLRKHV